MPVESIKTFVSFLGQWNEKAVLVKKRIIEFASVDEDNIYPNIMFQLRNDSIKLYLGKDTLSAIEKYNWKEPGIKTQLDNEIFK